MGSTLTQWVSSNKAWNERFHFKRNFGAQAVTGEAKHENLVSNELMRVKLSLA